MARTSRGCAAFTLMELLVVIAIMAIISTIAVGGYFGMIRAAAYSAARDNVYNTLSLTRQRSVIDGKVTSFMILDATNYVVVRAVGRISHIDKNVAFDAYTDLSGAETKEAGKQIEIYNLDAKDFKNGTFKRVTIQPADLSLRDPTVPDSEPYDKKNYNVSGYRFVGAGGDFFAVGDRYGFALHSQQSLPRGFLFTDSPQEIRFKEAGSCDADKTVTLAEKIRKDKNYIKLMIKKSGEIVDNSAVKK